MDLVKRVKELEDRLIEVMSAGAIKIKELEEALCQANGKLEELRDNPNASTEKDEEIINAFIDLIKAIDNHNYEDIDFLVLGWRTL